MEEKLLSPFFQSRRSSYQFCSGTFKQLQLHILNFVSLAGAPLSVTLTFFSEVSLASAESTLPVLLGCNSLYKVHFYLYFVTSGFDHIPSVLRNISYSLILIFPADTPLLSLLVYPKNPIPCTPTV